jgi:hypothetical protein
MIAGQIRVEVDDDPALVVLGHGPKEFRAVYLLVTRGKVPSRQK